MRTWNCRPGLAGLGVLVGLLAAPCGQAQGTWTQAYGNPANTGFVNATTNLPVAPRWAFQLDGPVSAGGPAVSPNKDGRVYVATAVGTVWSFNANGDFHCSRAYKGTTITSTPAILPNGDLAILITRPVGDAHQTSLARLTADCGEVWHVDLPVWAPGFTSTASGSVKIWTLNGTSFLFVHGRYTTNVNVLSHDPESFDELLHARLDQRAVPHFVSGAHGGGTSVRRRADERALRAVCVRPTVIRSS